MRLGKNSQPLGGLDPPARATSSASSSAPRAPRSRSWRSPPVRPRSGPSRAATSAPSSRPGRPWRIDVIRAYADRVRGAAQAGARADLQGGPGAAGRHPAHPRRGPRRALPARRRDRPARHHPAGPRGPGRRLALVRLDADQRDEARRACSATSAASSASATRRRSGRSPRRRSSSTLRAGPQRRMSTRGLASPPTRASLVFAARPRRGRAQVPPMTALDHGPRRSRVRRTHRGSSQRSAARRARPRMARTSRTAGRSTFLGALVFPGLTDLRQAARLGLRRWRRARSRSTSVLAVSHDRVLGREERAKLRDRPERARARPALRRGGTIPRQGRRATSSPSTSTPPTSTSSGRARSSSSSTRPPRRCGEQTLAGWLSAPARSAQVARAAGRGAGARPGARLPPGARRARAGWRRATRPNAGAVHRLGRAASRCSRRSRWARLAAVRAAAAPARALPRSGSSS